MCFLLNDPANRRAFRSTDRWQPYFNAVPELLGCHQCFIFTRESFFCFSKLILSSWACELPVVMVEENLGGIILDTVTHQKRTLISDQKTRTSQFKKKKKVVLAFQNTGRTFFALYLVAFSASAFSVSMSLINSFSEQKWDKCNLILYCL